MHAPGRVDELGSPIREPLAAEPRIVRARRTCAAVFFNCIAIITWYLWPSAFRKPSVAKLRALAGLPRLLDPFPDRDGFDEMYDRQLALVCTRGCSHTSLSHLGVLVISIQVFYNILNRKHLANAPPAPEAAPRKRVYIAGPFRSGTTLLQRVLATNAACKSFSLREFKNPIAPNLHPIKGMLRLVRVLAPHLLSIHPMAIDEPEECVFLLNASLPLMGLMPVIAACVEWHAELLPHMPEAYASYSRVVERCAALYCSPSESHLILKAPVHAYFIDALHADALSRGEPFVVLRTYRRDLAKVAGSFASLCRAMLDAIALQFDLDAIEETAVQAVIMQMSQLRRTNEIANADKYMRVIDIDFEDLVQRPADTVEALCATLELPYEADATASILAQAERSRKQKDRYAAYHGWQLSPRSLEILKECEKQMATLLSPLHIAPPAAGQQCNGGATDSQATSRTRATRSR